MFQCFRKTEREDSGLKKKKSLLQGPLMYLLLLAVIVVVVWMMGTNAPVPSVTLEYSEFLGWVENDLRAAQGETLPQEAAGQTIGQVFRNRAAQKVTLFLQTFGVGQLAFDDQWARMFFAHNFIAH